MTEAKPGSSIRPMLKGEGSGERGWKAIGAAGHEVDTDEREREYARIFGEDAAAALDRDEGQPDEEVRGQTDEWASFAEKIKKKAEERRNEGKREIEAEELRMEPGGR